MRAHHFAEDNSSIYALSDRLWLAWITQGLEQHWSQRREYMKWGSDCWAGSEMREEREGALDWTLPVSDQPLSSLMIPWA